MLPRQNRLKKTKDFERVFKQGLFINDRFITFKVAKNGLDATRFGFVVSTKISKKAVIRNKIKRWLRSAVSPFLKNTPSGFDVVVMTKPAIANSDFDEIKNIIEKMLAKINGLNIKN